MAISVFDLFSIGIGPSSSHTVGPMRAARRFCERLQRQQQLGAVVRVEVELFGSLGLTGRGHGSDRAVLMGLEGEACDEIDPRTIPARLQVIRKSGQLQLLGKHCIPFAEAEALTFHRRKSLPLHPNGMIFRAHDSDQRLLEERMYYSVGGGFVIDGISAEEDQLVADSTAIPYPFETAEELIDLCRVNKLQISDVMLENEKAWRSEEEVRHQLWHIWETMQQCVETGCETDGTLPGGLAVKRRAPRLFAELSQRQDESASDPLRILDWVNLYALAVNEENAAGGRVVTAPTNGAAGILPAVIHYYERFCPKASDDGIQRFLLTAGAIGILYKQNASISGAEVGCQGEVGVACSMAAGALAEARGGNLSQVENAAEIGMEHNLGLTCDPVGGLVQIPCIERNAMGAVKAINAARLALRGDGTHRVSLDKVIRTMRQTGADMQKKYKETSRGGLAVNVIEC